ncbi:MAG: galactose mutarotase [Silicimonas sp.]|jgi:aldose 1-epimerase|nr:galactose mutarotase [Silicimonas sp.]
MSESIRIGSDDLKIEVWPLGARLNGVWFRGIGSLVDGAADESEARGAKKFNGAVVGPVANRIANGSAEIAGHEHRFETNESGVTTLHSGSTGVHAQTWEVADQTDTRLVLKLALADGLGGFPGNRVLTAIYSVEGPALEVEFRATTDAPTWMNLALHPYWRLSQTGRAGMRLAIAADSYTPVDERKIPTGAVAPVTGTIFELGALAEPDTGIDHNFCLAPTDGPAVRAEGDLGVRLGITTTAPGIQVYSGKDIGIAIEPQHWPDAMHQPGFPDISLMPGEEYLQSTTYLFSPI